MKIGGGTALAWLLRLAVALILTAVPRGAGAQSRDAEHYQHHGVAYFLQKILARKKYVEEADRQGDAPIGRNREMMKSKLADCSEQEAAREVHQKRA